MDCDGTAAADLRGRIFMVARYDSGGDPAFWTRLSEDVRRALAEYFMSAADNIASCDVALAEELCNPNCDWPPCDALADPDTWVDTLLRSLWSKLDGNEGTVVANRATIISLVDKV